MKYEACGARRRNPGLLLLFTIPFAPHPVYGHHASVCGIHWQELSHTTRFQAFPGVVVVVVVVFVLALVAVAVMVSVVIVMIVVVVILALVVLMAVVVVVVFVPTFSVVD